MLRESRSPNGGIKCIGPPMQDPHW